MGGEGGLAKYRPGSPDNRTDALPVMEKASCFDPALLRVVLYLCGGTAKRFPTWQTLVNAAAQGQG